MTLTVRFSNDYYKLPESWNGMEAVLIGVSHCSDIQKLKKDYPHFIDYDSTIRSEDPWKQDKYPLDFKEGIILIFVMKETGVPFTTIRRCYPDKLKYYEGRLWETFKLEHSEQG
jgi:hypothetical protein